MAVDESDRLAPEGVGEVFRFLDFLRAAKNGIGRLVHLRAVFPVGAVIRRPVVESEILVEPAAQRLKLGVLSRVALADEPSHIAKSFQTLWEGLHRLGNSDLHILAQPIGSWVFLKPKTVLIKPAQESSPRGTANRRGRIPG